MDDYVSQSAHFAGAKQSQTLMGFFQYGVRYSTTTDELHQHLRIFGRPGRVLEKIGKDKSGKIRKLAIP